MPSKNQVKKKKQCRIDNFPMLVRKHDFLGGKFLFFQTVWELIKRSKIDVKIFFLKFETTGWKPILFTLKICISPNSLENVKNPRGKNNFLTLRLILGKRWKTRLFGLEICIFPNSLENVKNPCGNHIFLILRLLAE